MFTGTLKKVFEDAEHGTYDNTKQGKCSGCGACCSNSLYLTQQEIARIRLYIKANNIKEQIHIPALLMQKPMLDLTCPFMNMNAKGKCTIYEVRPAVCSCFMCNEPDWYKKISLKHIEKAKRVNMRETFFEKK